MQIKKNEVKEALLIKAEEEFLTKGFKHASLRKIVKEAGTTIGNFYNYFKNKESLFEELVKDEFYKLKFFIENHDKIERPDYLWNISDISEWRKVLKQLIIEAFPQFSDRFILLVEGSEGTKFENTRHEIIKLMRDHFIEHMERFDSSLIDRDFAEVTAEQMLSGMILILKKYNDENKRKELLTEHLLFYFIGTMGLIGSWD